MAKFDRYMLSQLLVLFGFFALVLVAVFWINRAVSLFDQLIGDGQSALVFLELSALTMPRLVTTVLPIATFAATVYVTNRLNNESELTVMMSTGSSPWRLARPVVLFGLVSAFMMSILAHDLEPRASAQLSERQAEISQNVTARLLTEGTFLSPALGITFYTRTIGEDGVLRDVFLADRRVPDERVIYTAAEAYLVRNDETTSLIMVDGLAQRLTPTDQRLSTAKFQDFSFDISGLIDADGPASVALRNQGSLALLSDWDGLAERFATTPGAIAEELHSRFARATFCLVTALVGFATLLAGGYSRFGVWREIVLAFALLLVLDGARGVLTEPVVQDARLWPILYAPSLTGLVITVVQLWSAARPGWLRRKFRRGVPA